MANTFVEGGSGGYIAYGGSTLVPSPSNGIIRLVKNINICNKAAIDKTVTVTYEDGVNSLTIYSPTLNSGDVLVFGQEDFYVLNSTSKYIKGDITPSGSGLVPFISSWADVD